MNFIFLSVSHSKPLSRREERTLPNSEKSRASLLRQDWLGHSLPRNADGEKVQVFKREVRKVRGGGREYYLPEM